MHQLHGALAVNVVQVVDQRKVVDLGIEDGVVANGQAGNELASLWPNI